MLLWALDGLNSFLALMGLPHLYAPSNLLRLITGALEGITIAAILLPAINITLWRAPIRDAQRHGRSRLLLAARSAPAWLSWWWQRLGAPALSACPAQRPHGACAARRAECDVLPGRPAARRGSDTLAARARCRLLRRVGSCALRDRIDRSRLGTPDCRSAAADQVAATSRIVVRMRGIMMRAIGVSRADASQASALRPLLATTPNRIGLSYGPCFTRPPRCSGKLIGAR